MEETLAAICAVLGLACLWVGYGRARSRRLDRAGGDRLERRERELEARVDAELARELARLSPAIPSSPPPPPSSTKLRPLSARAQAIIDRVESHERTRTLSEFDNDNDPTHPVHVPSVPPRKG